MFSLADLFLEASNTLHTMTRYRKSAAQIFFLWGIGEPPPSLPPQCWTLFWLFTSINHLILQVVRFRLNARHYFLWNLWAKFIQLTYWDLTISNSSFCNILRIFFKCRDRPDNISTSILSFYPGTSISLGFLKMFAICKSVCILYVCGLAECNNFLILTILILVLGVQGDFAFLLEAEVCRRGS